MRSYGHDPIGAHAEHVEITYDTPEPRRSRRRQQIVDQALMGDILGHPVQPPSESPSAKRSGGRTDV